MPSTPTWATAPKDCNHASSLSLPARDASKLSTPNSPPMSSSAAATCTSRCVSTPPVTARANTGSTMVIAIPSLSLGQGVARAAQCVRRRCDRPVGAGRSAALKDRTSAEQRIWALTDGSFSGQPTTRQPILESGHTQHAERTTGPPTIGGPSLDVHVPILPAEYGRCLLGRRHGVLRIDGHRGWLVGGRCSRRARRSVRLLGALPRRCAGWFRGVGSGRGGRPAVGHRDVPVH